MKKMSIALLLALVLSLFMAVPAQALTEGDWEFQLLDNEVQLTKYLGDGGDVVIPHEIRGAAVTQMKGGLNLLCKKATSILVPGTIKNVEFGTTYGWEELRSIEFCEGVETIEGCILQEFPNLTQVSLPSTLVRIKEHAFQNTGFRQINLPSSLKYIEDHAFGGSALETVDMSGLTNVTLGISCFSDCPNLREVKLPSDLQTIPQTMVANCKELTHIDIPISVTEIENLSFSNCGLTDIVIPSNMKKIGCGAFRGNKLTEVTIPYGVTKVGDGGKYSYGVFDDMPTLQAVYIPDTVTKMDVNIIDGSENAIIYCTADSFAANFCKKHEISYLTDNSVNSLITVIYNGKRISFNNYGQNPENISGRVLVPMRSIFEAMGSEIIWDEASSTATAVRNGIEVRVTKDSNVMYKNGQAITLDVPAQIINARTMVPVRAISEAFNAKVEWVASGRTALITE